ncbi:RNA polymerase sigma-70 factor (ECF subfamily) [Chitinophaga skermanii]|uniref:RNA polymerase sigma-70 factor (ECF subfamily) n=1 Tax=Chitinophaga skermanii TaxID=331697 RepID=A0A327QHM2_9BACT|nr:sigma-70 family RNA polymerase sigma factor [Chitinophaga skermanii]RAJ04049.1 RNA polymerase sigma-70 factor (ECF subfamily) [Chitinophaga skermanii]
MAKVLHSDQYLWTLMKSDDERAFREIYNRHWKSIYTQALIKTGIEEDACDITQEIFLYLWKNRQQIEMQVALSTYLHAALRHKIIDYYRTSTVKRRYIEQLFLHNDQTDVPQTADALNMKELTQLIDTEIQQMPTRMREIFLMSRDEELPSAQIAAKLQLSDQTVRNQISSAIQRIRKCIAQHAGILL